MLINLDGFESVMVRYGRTIANPLIYEISSRLREKIGEGGVLERFRRAQFAALVMDMQQRESAEDLAREIIEQLESSIVVEGTRFRLTASIGITLFPQHAREWRDLLDNADAAVHDAMTQGRGRISISFPAVR